MTNETKSPLKAPPLRVAGESLSDALIDNAFERLLPPVIIASLLLSLALQEWVSYFWPRKPLPWLFTVFAAVAVGYAVWQYRIGMRMAAQLKLGRSGERAVAQYLERFRDLDFSVFHDVPSGDANIDHVLIGPRGIFTIETKTLSKPVRGPCRITVDEGGVRANGLRLDRNPLPQAKAQARWLQDFLAEAQFKIRVQPAVVFPGWFVEPCDMKALGVWMLEPKALDAFIGNQAPQFAPDQVKAMASALTSYIRSKNPL
jgi:hypothetical protein